MRRVDPGHLGEIGLFGPFRSRSISSDRCKMGAKFAPVLTTSARYDIPALRFEFTLSGTGTLPGFKTPQHEGVTE
jgi:hypothetical protein